MDRSDRAISVVLADDEPHVLEYLRTVLQLEGFDVAGTAQTADGVVELAGHLHPDVALVDLRMPGGGLEAARLIGSLSPETRIVVFSASADADLVLPLLRAGIDGYVVKGSPPDRLADAIRAAIGGATWLAPEVNRVAIGELTERLAAEDRADFRETRRRDRVADVIANRRFEPVYQPIVDLATGRPVAVEALTRFHASPRRLPEAWFEEATSVGLGPSLELATASRALEGLDVLHPDLSMMVNVAPATVASGRLGEVLVGVDAQRVVIELTEHDAVQDYRELLTALRTWREHGVRLAVDDAGSGYASAAHILELSPELIKLDGALTRDLHADRHRRAMARAVVGFADELGIAVIAESVETAAELEVLVELGVSHAQGFHLGRPRPLAEQPELLTGTTLAPVAVEGLSPRRDLETVVRRERPLPD